MCAKSAPQARQPAPGSQQARHAQPLGHAREATRRAQPARVGEQLTHHAPGQGAGGGRRGGLRAQPLHLGPAVLDDPAVGDTGGADRFASPAAEAEVEVPGEILGEGQLPALPLRHQVEAPAGRLGLQVRDPVGGAVIEAEAAVHAGGEVVVGGRVRALEDAGVADVDSPAIDH